MSKLTTEVYLVLKPSKRSGVPTNGNRRVTEFKVDRILQNRPFTNRGEVAVKTTITLDSTVFDQLVPEVTLELDSKDLFINTRVEIEPDPEAAVTEDFADGHSDRDDHGDR